MTPEDLVEIELIKRLKYRYLRCLDQKLWDELATTLADDAVAEYSGGKYRHEGRDAIVEWISSSMASERMLTSHRATLPEIELLSPTTATGSWALDDVVVHDEYGITIRGAAWYSDEYVKIDGQWLILRTGYRRTYEELYPRDSITGLTLTASWWGTDGRSEIDA